jgi:hypothetical protein
METATNIFDLPADPANCPNPPPNNNNNNNNNLQLKAHEMFSNPKSDVPHLPLPPPQPQPSLDPQMLQQMVNTLHQASLSGATQLPSRDIPMHSGIHAQDIEATTNYIPSSKHNRIMEEEYYAQPQLSKEQMRKNYLARKNMQQSMDDLYEEMYGPLLVTIVIFIFQLPSFKTYLFSFFPVLFSAEGNYNVYGYLFSSILFGICYYLLQKLSLYCGNNIM